MIQNDTAWIAASQLEDEFSSEIGFPLGVARV